ncbi:hypothetical protein QE375_003442 [Microbacterium foliorum]|uniref:Transposase n=1 Tax=Microbacterium foliorum TaxID=104336 RepID=A0ABU1HW35_9MICO|nr:hypothetical protein [Microbacterium foliorum]MDR6143888.1 hypothetical protein [Microbacterium foliorum]
MAKTNGLERHLHVVESSAARRQVLLIEAMHRAIADGSRAEDACRLILPGRQGVTA